MTRTLTLFVVLALLTAGVSEGSEEIKDRIRDQASAATNDPSLTSSGRAATNQVTVLSVEGESTLAAQLGFDLGSDWNGKLRVQGNLEKGASEVTLADLSGLSSGTVASLEFSKISFGRNFDQEVASSLPGVCKAFNAQLTQHSPISMGSQPFNLGGHTFNPATLWPKSTALGNRAYECQPGVFAARGATWAAREATAKDKARFSTCAEVAKLGLPPVTPCNVSELQARANTAAGQAGAAAAFEGSLPERHATALLKELRPICEQYNTSLPEGTITLAPVSTCSYQELKKRGEKWAERAREAVNLSPILVSIGASLKSETFAFAQTQGETGSLEDVKRKEESYGLSITGGRLFSSRLYGGLTAKTETTWKGDPATEVCTPVEGAEALSCRSRALAPPSRKDTEIVEAELRFFASPKLALNPRLSHRLDDSATLAKVLLYFVQKPQGKDEKRKTPVLNGGIEASYVDGSAEEEENGFALRLFVGTSFGLLP